MAGDDLPRRYGSALARYRYGPGVCKVDWALRGPVPWAAEGCREAVTIHVGGTFDEIARSEADVNAGRHPDRPYCLVTQPCVVDPTRAPAGRHTLWAYCHVPNGSTVDMTERIEAQIERFAPGLPRPRSWRGRPSPPWQEEEHNPSYVGGDINAGCGHLAPDGLPARPCSGTRTAPRSRGSTCARPPPRPAAACTACAGSGRRAPPCTTSASGPRRA